jgi:DNA gyrase subunit B/topoisomerase-4 subunit B
VSYPNWNSAKLEDCQTHGEGTELFIVEGDSAAMSVCRIRDPLTQAVLPLQGKPLNAWKATEKKVAANQLFDTLVAAIGGSWGDSFSLAEVRYERVMLLFDPDADGIHCGALMSLYFLRWMRPLLMSGRIFVVHAPLLEIRSPSRNESHPAFSEEDYHHLLVTLRSQTITDLQIHRFRGLASLNADTLDRTCVSAATRRTDVLTLEDALAAVDIFGGRPK